MKARLFEHVRVIATLFVVALFAVFLLVMVSQMGEDHAPYRDNPGAVRTQSPKIYQSYNP